MARTPVSVKIDGMAAAIEALALVSKEANFAQRSAIRAAGTRARSTTVKALAAQTGVVQKVWAKRVKHFPGRREHAIATRKLWLGLKHKPKPGEHSSVEKVIRKAGDTFEQTMPKTGHRGLFRRRYKTIPVGERARERPQARRSLPIETARVDVSTPARSVLVEQATSALRGRYVEVLKQEFIRRLSRAKTKRKARR